MKDPSTIYIHLEGPKCAKKDRSGGGIFRGPKGGDWKRPAPGALRAWTAAAPACYALASGAKEIDSVSSDDTPAFRRSPHTAWQLTDEGGLLLHLRAHELTATNLTGVLLWEALAAPQTARQLSDLLM